MPREKPKETKFKTLRKIINHKNLYFSSWNLKIDRCRIFSLFRFSTNSFFHQSSFSARGKQVSVNGKEKFLRSKRTRMLKQSTDSLDRRENYETRERGASKERNEKYVSSRIERRKDRIRNDRKTSTFREVQGRDNAITRSFPCGVGQQVAVFRPRGQVSTLTLC